MTSITFSSGLLILIETQKDVWSIANTWQTREFLKAIKFGTPKSKRHHNKLTETEPFNIQGVNYQFIIHDDWGPCYIKNIKTQEKMEVTYHEIGDCKLNCVASAKVTTVK